MARLDDGFMRHKFFNLFNADNALCRALFLAKSATGALVVIDYGKVVHHLDCVVRTNARAESASKTSVFADCLGVLDTFHAV